MTEQLFPPTTAAIRPERFPEPLVFAKNRVVIVLTLAVLLAAGFGFRVYQLGAESMGEDEFNKLETVAEYRQNGLSSRNGEHPFLMKGLQTVSIVASEKINSSFGTAITEEGALRFPLALFGTFTMLLLFLLFKELFGSSIGLVTAALWSVEPLTISFDRVAKEDSLVLFFFLLASLFWFKSQTAAETGKPNWLHWVWATAAAFGALMASKYYLALLGVMVGYYHAFNTVPGKHWGLGRRRWLVFFIIMGITLLVLNPTLLFPDTWRQMLQFSSENRMHHDGYEYMGTLYSHKATLWLKGVPWTFYYVLAATKTSLTTLLFFIPGIVLMFRRKMGDGRIFLFFWFILWYLPFTLLGGKFMRYFTVDEPLLLATAAVGFCFVAGSLVAGLSVNPVVKGVVQFVLLAAFLVLPITNSVTWTPNYRLFTNSLGGGRGAAGKYFPHDEFYDAGTRDVIGRIGTGAPNGATIACETPELFAHYAEKTGRNDLSFISLSDKTKVGELKEGDYVVLTMGRRYFSNTAYWEALEASRRSYSEGQVNGFPSSKIYRLDATTLALVQAIARQ